MPRKKMTTEEQLKLAKAEIKRLEGLIDNEGKYWPDWVIRRKMYEYRNLHPVIVIVLTKNGVSWEPFCCEEHAQAFIYENENSSQEDWKRCEIVKPGQLMSPRRKVK